MDLKLPTNDQETDYIVFRFQDHDSLFKRVSNPILISDIDYRSENYAETLQSSVYLKRDELAFTAQCPCGHITRDFRIGTTCPICHGIVEEPTIGDGPLLSKVWMRWPQVDVKALNPTVYLTLCQHFPKVNKVPLLDYVLSPRLMMPDDLAAQIPGRGFKYFYENFDEIIEILLKYRPKPAKFIRWMLRKYRDIIFCTYFPLKSSTLHPITQDSESSKGFSDTSTINILSAAQTFSHLIHSPRHIREPDEHLYSAYKKMVDYVIDEEKKYHGKPGLFRKNIVGSRLHNTFRTVIGPIVGKHNHYDLHLPWVAGIRLLDTPLRGRLEHEFGYSIPEIDRTMELAETCMIPLLHQLMLRFIDESPFPGLPILFNRNPSIQRGALQLLYGRYVKPDPEDFIVNMSPLVVGPPNADFDGDNMTGAFLSETASVYEHIGHSPSRMMMDPTQPRVGNSFKLASQPIASINKFLGVVDENTTHYPR